MMKYPRLQKAGMQTAGQDGGHVRTPGTRVVVVKHRCLIMLQTKLGQTELALRNYFKTLMVLPCVVPTQCKC